MPTRRRKATEPPPLHLAGPPARLETVVTVENTTQERLAVRGPTFHLEQGPSVRGSASALVAPGATAAVPVTLALDPTTAPGDYPGELEVNGARRSAVLHVDEQPAVELSPRAVIAGPGTRGVRLRLANTGNVPVPLARRVLARTRDDGPDPGPDVVLELDSDPVLAPGESATLTGRLHVPDTLDPRRRHTATVPVGLADLVVTIPPRTTKEPS